MSDSSDSSSENEFKNALDDCENVHGERTIKDGKLFAFMKETWDLLDHVSKTSQGREHGEATTCQQGPVERTQSDVAGRLPSTENTLHKSSQRIRTQSESSSDRPQTGMSDFPQKVPSIYLSVIIRYLVSKDEIHQFDVARASKKLPTKIKSCTTVSDNICFLLHSKCNPENKCNTCSRANETTKICNLPCHCDVFLKNVVSMAHACKPADKSDVSDNDVYLDTGRAPPGYTKLVPVNIKSWAKETYDTSSGINYIKHPSRAETDDDRIFHGFVCKIWPQDVVDKFLHRSRPGDWPNLEVLASIVKSEFCLVSASQCSDTDWKFVFCDARRILQDAMTLSQKMCLALFQIIVQHATADNNGCILLKPFHLDTLMFHVCEHLPVHLWGPEVGSCFMTLIETLLGCLERHRLDNYFIPAFNMFANISTQNISKLITTIKQIRDRPLAVVSSLVNNHKLKNSGIIHCVNACVLRASRGLNLSVTISRNLTQYIVEIAKSCILQNKFEEAFLSLKDFFEMLQKVEKESSCGTQNTTDFQGFLELTLENEHDTAFSFWLMLYARVAHDIHLSLCYSSNSICLREMIQCDTSNSLLDIHIPEAIVDVKNDEQQLEFLKRVANLMRYASDWECYTCILQGVINKIDKSLKSDKSYVVEDESSSAVDDDGDDDMADYKRRQRLLMFDVLTELFNCHRESDSVDKFKSYYDLYQLTCERLGTSTCFW